MRFTWGQRIAADVIGGLSTFVFGVAGRHARHNCRWHFRGPLDGALRKGEPLILVAWHQDVLPLFHYLGQYTFLEKRRPMMMMSSRSFDGEITERIMRPFGYRLVRGSAGKAGGHAALKGLVRALDRGHRVTMIGDGPRPPPYVLRPGSIFLARSSGVPLYVIRVWTRPQWIAARTWFRMVIPAPGARYAVFSEGPIDVSGDLEEARLRVERALHRLGVEMDAFLYLRRSLAGGEYLAERGV